LTVNLAASFVLGIVAGAAASASTSALVGTGLCGTLSTYSTFGYETMKLGRDGHRPVAVGNVAVSVLLGVGAAALGWLIGAR
jgi:CrcB protein